MNDLFIFNTKQYINQMFHNNTNQIRYNQFMILNMLDQLYGSQFIQQPLLSSNPEPIILKETIQSSQVTSPTNQETQMISRQQAIFRYKEKKKNQQRRQVQYVSRKIVADSRPRFCGKFISKEEVERLQKSLNVPLEKILDKGRNINKKMLTNSIFTKLNHKKLSLFSIQEIIDAKDKISDKIIKKIQKNSRVFTIFK